jgi:DNA-binding transcriptional regulator YdaS (Cro superfamily)
MADDTNSLPMGHAALERAIAIKGLIALADELDVRYQIVQGWRDKKRKVAAPAEYCAAIEQATGGKVTRRDLRPEDWQSIWPELPGAAERLAAERAKVAA